MTFKTIDVLGHTLFNKVYNAIPDEDHLKIRIREIIAEMKKDINNGDYIKRKPYPDRYLRLGLHNLFVFDIGNKHGLIYTVRTTEDNKTYQFLDLLTHKEYDVVFGYSTS